MYRADITCAADDLVHYIDIEFGPDPQRPLVAHPTVEFWSDLVR